MGSTYTLTMSCSQRAGIVHAVTSFLLQNGCDIQEHQQFDDAIGGGFFLRTSFLSETGTAAALSDNFAEVAGRFDMRYTITDDGTPRVVVMVSRMGHCLNDLVFRWRAGILGADLVAVVSNHETLRPMAEAAGLPFFYAPVGPSTKHVAEQRLFEIIDEFDAEVVVLARYMQVLTDDACRRLYGRAINIHHSFLPGFKGAKPYHQAYDRGVKLVGATAHYVTPELDEGPIIEQEVIRIDHSFDPLRLATVGQDAEALALSRAVRWHCENRVLLHGPRTVVFK